MIVPIRANLEGATADRFLALARTLARSANRGENDRMALLSAELEWSKEYYPIASKDRLAFEAAVHVLLDLDRLGWQVREEGYGIELFSVPIRTRGLSPEEIQREKQRTRALFRPAVQAQLRDPAVVNFVRRMEKPGHKTGKKSVTLLIAEGAELHSRILMSSKEPDGKNSNPAPLISPYLQLASSEEVDEHTGHSLREIWRYFRFTWSIPQFATPGRQLLYLIRDAAHPCHAVMGIIGLNNTALQMGVERENDLEWSLHAIVERLKTASENGTMEEEYAWLETQLCQALDDIENKGLAKKLEIENPDEKIIARLRQKAREFDYLREETLRELAQLRTGNDGPLLPLEIEETELGEDHPPVAEKVLNLESKPANNPKMQKARRHLVARKRAALLAELLQARMTLNKNKERFFKPEELESTLGREDVCIALQTILDAVKSRYAGINILEISTCGAIPPYNHLLGGKLAALLLYSPQIVADYQRKYSRPSIISSQIKNSEVRRDNTVVYYSTTSLYAQGSSQYERVKLPAGVISLDQKDLRFRKLGLTAGFGTLQFMNQTRNAVENFLKDRQGFKDINNIFGEGPSPKLRLLVAGLRELGFSPDALMRHNRQRLIYATELTPEARKFLNNRPAELPDYLSRPHEFESKTENIAEYWVRRWLLSRIKHIPSMTALLTARQWSLSDQLPFLEQEGESPPNTTQDHDKAMAEFEVAASQMYNFWKQIAQSGPQVTSDSLSETEIDRLHVKLDVEDFIKKAVKEGKSLFLTGNAGDGKTHVLRRVADDLRKHNAIVIEDATATMRKGQIGPVLDLWREAVSSQLPFCIAINEYPLHLLRTTAKRSLPSLADELDRQCRNRLAYGPATEDELERKKLLVIDLSMRNPLNRKIAGAMLARILSDSEMDLVPIEKAPILKQNLVRLRDERVRNRFLTLLQRMADIGTRTTMRELWIYMARMVIGYRWDLEPSYGDSLDYRYSEILFESDPRFIFSEILPDMDPSTQSHPVWDSLLDDSAKSIESGWWFGIPNIGVTVRPNRKQFRALKRIFYFEHESGDQSFELEDTDAAEFRTLMQMEHDDDLGLKRRLIQAINRAFCPTDFPGSSDNIYLWSGHRFHEQPTQSFLANRFIPFNQLQLMKPRIPKRVLDALPDYSPDHLLLRHASSNGFVAKLRVDFPLFKTLQLIGRGLPRKLLPERDSFRLETFIESLDGSRSLEDRRVFSAHLKRRELLEIQMSQDMEKYEKVVKHA